MRQPLDIINIEGSVGGVTLDMDIKRILVNYFKKDCFRENVATTNATKDSKETAEYFTNTINQIWLNGIGSSEWHGICIPFAESKPDFVQKWIQHLQSDTYGNLVNGKLIELYDDTLSLIGNEFSQRFTEWFVCSDDIAVKKCFSFNLFCHNSS